MPRRPLGDKPMTNAQRQARHRTARATARPVIHYRRAADRRSRAQRWRDAVAELFALQAEYATWLDALPETLRDGATVGLQPAGLTRGEALQAIPGSSPGTDHDFDDLLAIEPPRRYGRD
jgi:hypothetical protein